MRTRHRPAAFEKLFVHQHCRRYDRSSQSTASDLVDADEIGKFFELLQIETAELAAFHSGLL
jgi:hypothetical protein